MGKVTRLALNIARAIPVAGAFLAAVSGAWSEYG